VVCTGTVPPERLWDLHPQNSERHGPEEPDLCLNMALLQAEFGLGVLLKTFQAKLFFDSVTS